MGRFENRLQWAIKIGPLLLIIGIGLLLTLIFVKISSTETAGQVVNIRSLNDTCREGRRGHRFYECTKYYADVIYKDKNGVELKKEVDAGKQPHHSQPINFANLKVGQTIQISYLSKYFKAAFSDQDLFIMTLMCGISLLLGSVLTFFRYNNKL
jgi:hypothetical protein